MAGKDLDALAKGLAEERISRGKALKRVGAAILGGLLAAGRWRPSRRRGHA